MVLETAVAMRRLIARLASGCTSLRVTLDRGRSRLCFTLFGEAGRFCYEVALSAAHCSGDFGGCIRPEGGKTFNSKRGSLQEPPDGATSLPRALAGRCNKPAARARRMLQQHLSAADSSRPERRRSPESGLASSLCVRAQTLASASSMSAAMIHPGRDQAACFQGRRRRR